MKHQTTINEIIVSVFAGSYFKPRYPCDLFVSSNKLQKKREKTATVLIKYLNMVDSDVNTQNIRSRVVQ